MTCKDASVVLLSKRVKELAGGHGHISDRGAACHPAAAESKVLLAVLSCLKVWPGVGWLKSWHSPGSRNCACQAELLESSIPGQHSPSLWIRSQMVAQHLGFHQAWLLCLLQGLLRETGAVCGAVAEHNA